MGNFFSQTYDVSNETFYKCQACGNTFPFTEDRFSIKHGREWQEVCSSACLAAWQRKHVASGECCSGTKNLHEKLI